ncbi:hypothetical protein [Streptomyces sp. B6B3]|uniref:hypothetical protein n=1 Tax=Streptomyces sp. B6B3 TaxID=3153570 RepID=UPI00325F0A79
MTTPDLVTPDLTALPVAEWKDDTRAPIRLTPARTGVHLGRRDNGEPVALPVPGPAGTRVAVLGESLFVRMVALRLLAVGAHVTAATKAPYRWNAIRDVAGERLLVTEDPAPWPRATPAPPTVDAGPQVLVTDLRRAPSAALADGPWRTVIHVTRTAPRRAAFWSHPDALVALSAAQADQVGHLLGREAAHRTSQLTAGQIILFRPGSSEILRPDVSPGEKALLTPDQQTLHLPALP